MTVVAARLAVAALAVALLAACDEPPPLQESPENPFQRAIERPEWLASVSGPPVSNADEVGKLWRSEPRCCVSEGELERANRAFFRSCYDAIGAHYRDEALVVKCLWLMDSAAEGDLARQIKRFLVDNYFDHDQRVDDCANCAPGDTVARVSRELAMLRLRAERPREAVELIERVLDERLDEVSPWVQVELYESLGRAYLAAQVDDAARQRLERAYARLDELAQSDEAVARRLPRFVEVYRAVSESAR